MSRITVDLDGLHTPGQIAQFYNALVSRTETSVTGGPEVEIHARGMLAYPADVPDDLRVFVSPGDESLSPGQLRELQEALHHSDSRVTVLPPRSEVRTA